MARVNFCGFETGDTSECNSTGGTVGTLTVQTTTARTGYALRVNAGTAETGFVDFNGVATTGLPSIQSIPIFYVRFYFLYLTKPTSASEDIFSIADDANLNKIYLRIDLNGNLSVYDVNQVQLGSTGTT